MKPRQQQGIYSCIMLIANVLLNIGERSMSLSIKQEIKNLRYKKFLKAHSKCTGSQLNLIVVQLLALYPTDVMLLTFLSAL